MLVGVVGVVDWVMIWLHSDKTKFGGQYLRIKAAGIV